MVFGGSGHTTKVNESGSLVEEVGKMGTQNDLSSFHLSCVNEKQAYSGMLRDTVGQTSELEECRDEVFICPSLGLFLIKHLLIYRSRSLSTSLLSF